MSATKIDYRKELGGLYRAKPQPVLVDVPEMAFLMVDGSGDPNTSGGYRSAVEALFAVSYALKFAIREARRLDYAVMPLEGLWWTEPPQRFTVARKDEWLWTMMIMQPEVVEEATVAEAVGTARRKRELPAADAVRLVRIAEGRCAQLLHVGPYSAEGPSVARLHDFIAEQGMKLTGRHHEIYLGDPRRSAPETLRTIIRQPVAAGADAE